MLCRLVLRHISSKCWLLFRIKAANGLVAESEVRINTVELQGDQVCLRDSFVMAHMQQREETA